MNMHTSLSNSLATSMEPTVVAHKLNLSIDTTATVGRPTKARKGRGAKAKSEESSPDSPSSPTHPDCVIFVNGKKRYQCTQTGCGKTFSFRCNLKRHYSTHTGVKPFTCEVCEKKFSRKDDMKIHQRVHTGEKPYDCSLEGCKGKFARLADLRAHERTHGIHASEKGTALEMDTDMMSSITDDDWTVPATPYNSYASASTSLSASFAEIDILTPQPTITTLEPAMKSALKRQRASPAKHGHGSGPFGEWHHSASFAPMSRGGKLKAGLHKRSVTQPNMAHIAMQMHMEMTGTVPQLPRAVAEPYSAPVSKEELAALKPLNVTPAFPEASYPTGHGGPTRGHKRAMTLGTLARPSPLMTLPASTTSIPQSASRLSPGLSALITSEIYRPPNAMGLQRPVGLLSSMESPLTQEDIDVLKSMFPGSPYPSTPQNYAPLGHADAGLGGVSTSSLIATVKFKQLDGVSGLAPVETSLTSDSSELKMEESRGRSTAPWLAALPGPTDDVAMNSPNSVAMMDFDMSVMSPGHAARPRANSFTGLDDINFSSILEGSPIHGSPLSTCLKTFYSPKPGKPAHVGNVTLMRYEMAKEAVNMKSFAGTSGSPRGDSPRAGGIVPNPTFSFSHRLSPVSASSLPPPAGVPSFLLQSRAADKMTEDALPASCLTNCSMSGMAYDAAMPAEMDVRDEAMQFLGMDLNHLDLMGAAFDPSLSPTKSPVHKRRRSRSTVTSF